MVLWKRPRGPTRLGPSRSCMSAITFSSSWITTKAVGMVSSSRSVVASTKRPSPSSRLKSISGGSLLVDAAHDRVEAGHDGHGVGDQVAGHQEGHNLQADEARSRIRNRYGVGPPSLMAYTLYRPRGLSTAP